MCKPWEERTLIANAQGIKDSLSFSSYNLDKDQVGRKSLPIDDDDLVGMLEEKMEKVLSLAQETREELVLVSPQVSSPAKKLSRSKTRHAGETEFNESRFSITPTMQLYLSEKYPEFVQGDIDWMEAKFKLRFAGTRYTYWDRTFYNFIENQLVKYNYRPGTFDWRTNNNGQTKQLGSQFESAAERNGRLEREADEYTRQLQSSGRDSHQEDSPLAFDDTDASS